MPSANPQGPWCCIVYTANGVEHSYQRQGCPIREKVRTPPRNGEGTVDPGTVYRSRSWVQSGIINRWRKVMPHRSFRTTNLSRLERSREETDQSRPWMFHESPRGPMRSQEWFPFLSTLCMTLTKVKCFTERQSRQVTEKNKFKNKNSNSL